MADNTSGPPTGIRAKARKLLRRTWMKHAMKGVSRADAYDRLDRAYALQDPWNLDSDLEKGRFEWTNRLIERQFGALESILEIGCGEGHQTRRLIELCKNMYGIDVSARAVARARAQLPDVQLAVTDLSGQPWGGARGRFDLITACEVLYYVSDLEVMLDRMNHLGRHCLVTVFAPGAPRVWAELRGRIEDRRDWYCVGNTVWVAGWWSNE